MIFLEIEEIDTNIIKNKTLNIIYTKNTIVKLLTNTQQPQF